MVLSALALSACDGSGEDSGAGKASETSVPGRTEKLSTIGTDPQIIVHDMSVAPGMIVKGRLGYLRDGKCLVVQGERAGEKFTASPAWPKGVEPVLTGDKRGVKVPGLGVISEGDSIVAGGNFWGVGDKRAKGVEIDARCLAEDGFIVFNADSFES